MHSSKLEFTSNRANKKERIKLSQRLVDHLSSIAIGDWSLVLCDSTASLYWLWFIFTLLSSNMNKGEVRMDTYLETKSTTISYK